MKSVRIHPEDIYPNTVNVNEFRRLDGVLAPIQTQLDSKMAVSLASEDEEDFIIKGAANWENTDRESVLLAMHNMNKYAIIKEDFHSKVDVNGYSEPFRAYSGGGGSVDFTPAILNNSNEVGVCYCKSNTALNGRAVIGLRGVVSQLAGNGPIITEFSVKSVWADDGTDTQRIRIGSFNSFNIAVPYDCTIGAWFEGEVAVNAKWRTVTDGSAGVATEKVSGTTAGSTAVNVNDIASDYMTFRIVINSDASQIDFYINDVLVNTHSTALGDVLPNDGATDRLCHSCGILKTLAGTAQVTGLYVDRFQLMWYCGVDRK